MTLTETEITARIDEIQTQSTGLGAEARNILHACRPNHPLGAGQDRAELFRNAAFVLSGRQGVSTLHVEWLENMSNRLAAK